MGAVLQVDGALGVGGGEGVKVSQSGEAHAFLPQEVRHLGVVGSAGGLGDVAIAVTKGYRENRENRVSSG